MNDAPFAFRCPKCGSGSMVISTKPDLMIGDRFLWVVKCGGGHLVHPGENDELRIDFR